MAASKVSLKLLIDTKGHRVLFAETGKDFVDFLFNILSLPVRTVIRLLVGKGMVGCLGNLYKSIQSLDETYMQPNQDKETILNPKTPTCEPLLLLSTEAPRVRKYYMCGSKHFHVTDDPNNGCPTCRQKMATEIPFVSAAAAAAGKAEEEGGGGGYVKGVVTCMVMDDLNMMPMSTNSSITLLKKFNVKDVGSLEERVVHLDMAQGVKLLKASLESKTALSTVFLGKTTGA